MRRAVRLTGCCLLGIGSSIAAAWAAAIWAPNDPSSSPAKVLRDTSLGLPVQVIDNLPAPDAYVDRDGVLRQVRLLYRSPEFGVGSMVYISVSGFPFPCLLSANFDLVGATEAGFVTAQSWRSGVPASPLLHPAGPGRTLPLVPVPIPLAANFAIWSVAYITADLIWHRIRSQRRLRKQLCVECGHPGVGSTACPECGHAMRSGKPA
jgi:hypothetical protein